MLIKQFANYPVTINRFDTGEELTIDPNVEVDVDDETGSYLINMRSYCRNEVSGEMGLATDIRQI